MLVVTGSGTGPGHGRGRGPDRTVSEFGDYLGGCLRGSLAGSLRGSTISNSLLPAFLGPSPRDLLREQADASQDDGKACRRVEFAVRWHLS